MRAAAARPAGTLRLISMLAMLAVLAMLIARAADPGSWVWLTGETPADVAAQKEAADKAADPKPPAVTPAAAPTPEQVVDGTDLDPDELATAQEQFQALSDFTLDMGREEMPAYWRLFRWSKNQPLAQLEQRADKNVLFNQFIDRNTRDAQRGKLFKLDLTVRRILSYPAAENSAGVEQVYEILGTTEQSQAWFYMLLTDELPAGMPTGAKIHERATFVGYFLKVQGYQHAGAGPTDKPLPAPLLIGRLQWRPAQVAAAQSDWEWLWQARNSPWMWWIVGTVAVFCFGRLALWLYRRNRPIQAEFADGKIPPHKVGAVRDWLDKVEEDNEAVRGYGNADYQNN